MKKKYLLLSLFLIAAFTTITTTTVNSKITSPPAGSSGDPFSSQTCAQGGCHPSPTQTPGPTDLALTIGTGSPTTPLGNTFMYDENTDYNIEFAINSSTGRYGFQIVALRTAHTQAGTFTVTNPATTKINTLSSRQYMGHLNANTTKNWTFRWTAPAANTGDVTFYYAYNTAGAPLGTPVGDVIYKGSVTISPNPSGIENIFEKISSLSVFPNPVTDKFSISFEMKEANAVSSHLYSLDGKLCKELVSGKFGEGNFHEVFNINELPAGIYLLKLNVGSASISKKIIKQ